jgi:hypothetical protein
MVHGVIPRGIEQQPIAATSAFDLDGEGYAILVAWSQMETIAAGYRRAMSVPERRQIAVKSGRSRAPRTAFDLATGH